MEHKEIASWLNTILNECEEETPKYAAVQSAMRIVATYHEGKKVTDAYCYYVNFMSELCSLLVGVCGIVTIFFLLKLCIFRQFEDLIVIAGAGAAEYILAWIAKYMMEWA